MDATDETGRYGRLINHSLKNPNCATKVIKVVNKTYDHLSLIINDFSQSFANTGSFRKEWKEVVD